MSKRIQVFIDQAIDREYGMYIAIVLDAVRNRIEYHLGESKRNRTEPFFKLHDGHAWVNTAASYIANHLNIDRSTVTKHLSKLVEAGILTADDFGNKQGGMWYAFSHSFITSRPDFFHQYQPPTDEKHTPNRPVRGGDKITSGGDKITSGGDKITSGGDSITSKGGDKITPSLYIYKNIKRHEGDARASAHTHTHEDGLTEEGTTEASSPSTQSPKQKPQKAGRSRPVKENPPSLEEVLDYAAQIGYSDSRARFFFEYYTTPGEEWLDAARKPVLSWRRKMQTWKNKDEENGSGYTSNPEPSPTGKHWSHTPDLSRF